MRTLTSIQTPPVARDRHVASRVARHTAFALALVVATACGDSDSPSAPNKPPVAGAYAMSTARGFAVPHTFTDAAGSKLTVQGGSLTLGSNGTYELAYKGKLNAITFDLTDEGTFVVAGSAVTFTPSDGDPAYTGQVQSGKVVVAFKIAGAMFDLGFKAN